MGVSKFTKVLLVVGFSAFSSMASADLIPGDPLVPGSPWAGNDCAGVFGQGFDNCKIPVNVDPNETPIIIKFNFAGGEFTVEDINEGLFPTIDGSEFSFEFTGEGQTGTWTYNPGAGDPGINFFAAKGSNSFNLFSNLGDPLSDDWFTPINNGGQQAGLSHLSFYDTDGGGQVPEPTTLLLLGAGLFAAGVVRRRVKRD